MASISRINDIRIEQEDKNLKFNAYEDISVVGQKIYKSFTKLWKKDKGVSLTGKEDGKYGTIANIMALSSMLEFDSMGIDITKDVEKFKFLIESVFNSVYHGRYATFDASPYFINTDTHSIDSYVETASKIFIVMIDLRKYAIVHSIAGDVWIGDMTLNRRNINSFDELASAAEDLFIDSMDALMGACLPTRENGRHEYRIGSKKIERDGFSPIMEYRGWSFQKPDGNPDDYGASIYFTYHATNAYVSLYNAFPHILNSEFFTDRVKSEDEKTDTDKALEEEVKKFSDSQLKKHNIDILFLKRHKSDIKRFRAMCSSDGRYFDTMLKNKDIDLSFDYVKNGFGKVSVSQVLDSQKNNYVMETLFVIAILMNAGVDEDYESIGQDDYIYIQISYALTNIKKVYNVLRRNNREDLIGSFVLSSSLFTEKIPSKHDELIRKFRNSCENISTYDLVPLLCNTYSIIFSYLIKYPNKDMVDNLELIMENRALGDNWTWDKDGFNINNNLYYIVAIENFYDYYNEYELPYTSFGIEYNAVAENALNELRAKVDEVEDKKRRLAELQDQLDNKSSELDNQVIALAQKVFDKNFESRLNAYIEKMIDDCITLNIKYAAGDDELKNLLAQYPNAETLLTIANAENFINMVSYNGASDEEELNMTKDNISKKVQEALKSKKEHANKE